METFLRFAHADARRHWPLSAGAALADYELNILHINDFHSRIEIDQQVRLDLLGRG